MCPECGKDFYDETCEHEYILNRHLLPEPTPEEIKRVDDFLASLEALGVWS